MLCRSLRCVSNLPKFSYSPRVNPRVKPRVSSTLACCAPRDVCTTWQLSIQPRLTSRFGPAKRLPLVDLLWDSYLRGLICHVTASRGNVRAFRVDVVRRWLTWWRRGSWAFAVDLKAYNFQLREVYASIWIQFWTPPKWFFQLFSLKWTSPQLLVVMFITSMQRFHHPIWMNVSEQ